MQRVRRAVERQLIFHAVERESAARDAIAKPADQRSEMRLGSDVGGQLVKSQNHIRQLSIPIRNPQANDFAAVVGDLHADAVLVDEGVEIDFPPVEHFAEHGPADSCLGCFTAARQVGGAVRH